MGLFDIFKKNNKLKEDFCLSEYFDPYYHSGDMYIATRHCVQKRVVIPNGPQGYTTIKIPAVIRTKEKLFAYLIKNHNFKLPTFRLKSNEGYIWRLTYKGHTRYIPNRSSASGYGSDDWFYLCEENGTYYLLMFTGNASFGTAWMITELLYEDYNYLIKAKAAAWGAIANSAERTHQWGTHLLNINDVRRLLPTYSHSYGKEPKQQEISFHSYSTVTKDGQFLETIGYNKKNEAADFFNSLTQEEHDALKNCEPDQVFDQVEKRLAMPVDDDHIRLSDWHTSKDYYCYKNVTGCVFNNWLTTFIQGDLSYKAMLVYREYLTDQLGFTLVNEYGITDMVQEYTYRDESFCLTYYEWDGDVFFKVQVEKDIVPKYYFDTALALCEIDVSDCK